MKILIKSFILFFAKISHLIYCPNCGTKLTLIFVDPISPLGKSSTILLIVIRVNIYCIHSRLSTFRFITQRYDTTIPCVVILCGVMINMEERIQYDLMLSRLLRYCMKKPSAMILVLAANFEQFDKIDRNINVSWDDTRFYLKLTNVHIILG